MMRACLVLLVLLLLAPVPLGAQTTGPATYAQRALLFTDTASIGRVTVGVIRQSLVVGEEPPNTPSHAQRNKFASLAIKEPEMIARRMIVVIGSSEDVPVTATVTTPPTPPPGSVPTPPVTTVTITFTDAELQAYIAAHWTLFADMFVTPAGTPTGLP